jgi:hypothetical protein
VVGFSSLRTNISTCTYVKNLFTTEAFKPFHHGGTEDTEKTLRRLKANASTKKMQAAFTKQRTEPTEKSDAVSW